MATEPGRATDGEAGASGPDGTADASDRGQVAGSAVPAAAPDRPQGDEAASACTGETAAGSGHGAAASVGARQPVAGANRGHAAGPTAPAPEPDRLNGGQAASGQAATLPSRGRTAAQPTPGAERPAPPALAGRVLLVTNDFPPRAGGIQSFVHGMATRLPVEHLVVYCSTSPGAADFDARQPFPVVRADTTMLLPTPAVARRAARLAVEHDCDAVWFGAAAPLGLLAHGLKRRTGVNRAVGLTHGHEVGWAKLPVARTLLRRIARGCDTVTYLADYSRARLAPAIGGLTDLEQLTFGIDTAEFAPTVSGAAIRDRHGLGSRPVIGCVSRLVPRKGQDRLIDALRLVRRSVPDAALLLVGGGPYESALRRRAAAAGLAEHVVFAGAVPAAELPACFAAADVFAMPCRTRRRGLDVEGLGVVFLEAAATGLPVIAGDSGGAPDTVRHGETGYVVDGRDPAALARRLITLLTEPQLATGMGEAGRAWMERAWTWPSVAARLAEMLRG